MGVSTDGIICYGMVFDEGTEFPWDDYEDEQEWWREVNQFVNPIESPFDDTGNWKPEFQKPKGKQVAFEKDCTPEGDKQSSAYFEAQREWDKANPLPFEMVNYCSYDCPMYILAIPSSLQRNSRGFPVTFDPKLLTVSEQDIESLKSFCEKYGIELQECHWYLASFWG